MPQRLSSRPDIRQLRRQAKELYRAALAGDETAVGRLAQVGKAPTLSSAQLALAREYGFASWPFLRRAVADVDPRPHRMRIAPRHRSASLFNDNKLGTTWGGAPSSAATLFTFGRTFESVVAFHDRLQPLSASPAGAAIHTGREGSPLLAISYSDSGGAAMVAEVERQADHSPGGQYVLVGTAAIAGDSVEVGDVVVVERAVPDDALSHYYVPSVGMVQADGALTARLLDELHLRRVKAKPGATWTVPTLYRSLELNARRLTAKDVEVVDYETASLLAVAQSVGAAAAACLVVTATMSSNFPYRGPSPAAIVDAALATLGIGDPDPSGATR